MESPPPSSSTPPPPPGAPKPPQGEGSTPQAEGSTPPAEAPPAESEPLPNIEVTICPVCREPRAEDARFCEECGHDYGGQAPVPAEDKPMLSGPVLWAIMLFWIALAIGGLYFLYNALWAI